MTANRRLTATAGAALLAVIVAQLATLYNLAALLSVHVFVGVLLAGPLAVKLAPPAGGSSVTAQGSPRTCARARLRPRCACWPRSLSLRPWP